MCCSELSVKGGMVSVVKNYLGYENWEEFEIVYVPTHTEKNKIIVALYFFIAFFKVLFLGLFGNISIAHLHTAERGSFYRKAILVRVLHLLGIKTIMHHHAAEFELFYKKLNERQKKFVCKTLKLTDLNLVLSKRLVSMIKDKSPSAKVSVLYNAVPTFDKNPYDLACKNCLFLGRLGKRKGTYDLLEAIKLADTKLQKDVAFYLCGDGEIEQVRDKVKELGIGHRIAHIGWVDGDQKRRILEKTAINILPSYNEGLPMSILEAMSFGIPNISTNIASIPEVIFPSENGYLLTPGDVKSLADYIVNLMSDNELRSNMSINAYNFINDSFCLDKHISMLKSLYRQVLNN